MASRVTQDTKVVIVAQPASNSQALVTQVSRVIIATVYTAPPYTPQGLLLKGLGS